jgi:hypothetical protein
MAEHEGNNGPVLIYMANVMAKPKAMWGMQSINRNIEARKIVIPVIGVIVGLLFALVVHVIIGTILVIVWLPIFFGAIFWLFTVINPPGGEKSFLSWLTIWIKGQRGHSRVEGERSKVYLDLALLNDPEDGEFFIDFPTVPVAPGTVDQHGLFV